MSGKQELIAHLQTGATTVCRAWRVTRKDGVVLGFTDHDVALQFDGTVFSADSGLASTNIQRSTGMAVDNAEVVGAFNHDSIREEDIAAGRYDGASVEGWLVNWADPDQRVIKFAGTFGEIRRSEGKFKVELRGLADPLNLPNGRVYQKNCSAVLGDRECKVDLTRPEFMIETPIVAIPEKGKYEVQPALSYAADWFQRGRITVLSGRAKDIVAQIKFDRLAPFSRLVEPWVDFEVQPEVGDIVRLEAGCDKLENTCKSKFANFLNFRGFPHIPGSDWIMSYPGSTQNNNGGSRFR